MHLPPGKENQLVFTHWQQLVKICQLKKMTACTTVGWYPLMATIAWSQCSVVEMTVAAARGKFLIATWRKWAVMARLIYRNKQLMHVDST